MTSQEYRAQWHEKHKDADVLVTAKDGTPIRAEYGYYPPMDVEAMLEILRSSSYWSGLGFMPVQKADGLKITESDNTPCDGSFGV